MDTIWHPGVLITFWAVGLLWILALLAFSLFELIVNNGFGEVLLHAGYDYELIIGSGYYQFSMAVVYIVLCVVSVALDLPGVVLYAKRRLRPVVYLSTTTVKCVFTLAAFVYQAILFDTFALFYFIFSTPVL